MVMVTSSIPWTEEELGSSLNDYYRLSFVEYEFPELLGQADDYPYVDPAPQYPGFFEYLDLWTGAGFPGQFRHEQDGLWHFLGLARLLNEKSDGDETMSIDTPGIQAIEFLSSTELRLLGGATYPDDTLKGVAVVLATTDGHFMPFSIDSNSADLITISPFRFMVKSTIDFTVDLVTPVWLTYRDDYVRITEGVTIGATDPWGAAFLVFNEGIDMVAARPGARPWAEICEETIVHEMVHTYDTRDNCGRTATDGSKCLMTYRSIPALVYGQDGSVEGFDWDLDVGPALCPEHILAIRKDYGSGGN